jgi:hypothetical protein
LEDVATVEANKVVLPLWMLFMKQEDISWDPNEEEVEKKIGGCDE